MTEKVLRTNRLSLRPLDLSDSEALFPIFNDEETMRYWAHGPVRSLDGMRESLKFNLAHEGEPPNAFAVCETDPGPALGWVSLYAFSHGNAGAGYILGKSARGKGYAQEAMTALLDHAFGARGLHRIYLDIDPENSASIRLAQRMGFRWEGHFKESFFRDGVYFDSVFYAMLAREWRAIRG